MSILIKGMKMPKCCAECDAEGHYENYNGDEYGFFCPFGYKAYTEKTRDAKRLDSCPLVPIPPHGDLIDRDALKEQLEYVASLEWNQRVGASPGIECAIDMLDDAQTIIPEEEGET